MRFLAERGEDDDVLDEDDLLNDPALETIRSQTEDRWCKETVPALGGFSSREAAADLTRRLAASIRFDGRSRSMPPYCNRARSPCVPLVFANARWNSSGPSPNSPDTERYLHPL